MNPRDIKTTVKGKVDLKANGSVEFNSTIKSYGVIDETFTYYQDQLTHSSNSTVPKLDVIPKFSALGSIDAKLTMEPEVTSLINGLLKVKVNFLQDYNTNSKIDSVPEVGLVSNFFPGRISQLSELNIDSTAEFKGEASILGLSLSEAEPHSEQDILFRLPKIELRKVVASDCSFKGAEAKQFGGFASEINEPQIKWISRSGDNAPILGPEGEWLFDQPIIDDKALVIFSAPSMPLGELSRRFFTKNINIEYEYFYKVRPADQSTFKEEGYIATGNTLQEACDAFGAINDSWDYGWYYVGVENQGCKVIAGLTEDGREIDPEIWPVDRVPECR